MDHKTNQRLLSEVLEVKYDVISEETIGKSRKDIIAAEPFDIAVMEFSRPEHILDTVKQRKQAEQPAFLPLLFVLPSHSPKGQSEELMRIFDGIIYPPIRKLDLLNRVDVLLMTRVMSLELIASNKQLSSVNTELRRALDEIQTLRGILPICSYCKKIRDDKGSWNSIEDYIHEHSEAEFSHGICQECAEKYFPDDDLYDDN